MNLQRRSFLLLSLALLAGCFRQSAGDSYEALLSSAFEDASLKIVQNPSPNFDTRKLPISLIVLHYTGGHFPESLQTLTDGNAAKRVSAHYLVDTDGTVYALVDEAKRAWHAGVAKWNTIRDVNSASIGIEIVNLGPRADGTFIPYEPKQIAAVTRLCLDIQSRYDIQAVIGHSDVAPGRKIDPGPAFPWDFLKAHDVRVCAH